MFHSILSGKTVSKVSKILNRSGSTWPGHIALKADPQFIKKALQKNPGVKVILIAGTNGKTTTTKALTHILEQSEISVMTNQTGANLLNGLASLLIQHITLQGVLRHKALIFEVDENSLPLVLHEIPNPHAIILLNLFRDQLDRYGEVNTTAEKWRSCFEKLSDKTLVVANADDPLVSHVASAAHTTSFFTIDAILKKEKTFSHAVDSTICPVCSTQLSYSAISYSHVGNYKCPNCGFKNPVAKKYDFKTSLKGVYNMYNLTSAILVADKIFGINPYTSTLLLKDFKPAFGRQETVDVEGKKVMILLSKNPTGFNESIKVVNEIKPSSLLILLNDRIPDGRDISWIWDVDFERISSQTNIFVSGDRCYDLANRLLFANITHTTIDNFETAYQEALRKTADKQTLVILPTYSAMLEIRKFISGKAIL